MKVLGHFKDLLQTIDGHGILTLKIDFFRHLEMLKELDPNKSYSIEIKEIKSNRSLEQNRLLWLLIHEIDKEMNGSSHDEMSIYTMLLERSSAKFDYIGALEVTEPMLKANFRHVQRIKEIDLNGKQGFMYKCFLGSSKMNTKEMKQLIDCALDVAGELGLDVIYWKEQFR
jgi:hypothetical protein